ncbi:MAG TPA: STM3941 family protein [Pyrinomonadaceae bacterium]|nr:STM3941 family protein [Pyrinomonadaceae bacterium]
MDAGDVTIIELGKRKLLLLLLATSVFVAAGIWLLSLDGANIQSRRSFNDPVVIHAFGLVLIVFCGSFALYALKKLFDRKPALIFNSSGIVDNASSVSPGFIPWSDVAGAQICKIQNEKLLIINVRDPRKYIARGNSLRRALNKANHNMVGSPISIAAHTLEINFSELAAIFDRYQRTYCVSVDGGYLELEVERKEPWLLNWSPSAVMVTLGTGGGGILVLLAASLDMLFRIQIPFWVAATISMLPLLIFYVAVRGSLPGRIVRPALWFGVVWYLAFAALSISLMAYRGFEPIYLYLAGFILLGGGGCLITVRKLRAGLETNAFGARPAGGRNAERSGRWERG